METKIIEAAHHEHGGNWGKFMVCRMDVEWNRTSVVDEGRYLLGVRGWSAEHLWVLDLETGEGVCVYPGGSAYADLQKHQVWVCPLFEPFLSWLYGQDLRDLQALPDVVYLPDAEFALSGYRRPGRTNAGSNPAERTSPDD